MNKKSIILILFVLVFDLSVKSSTPALEGVTLKSLFQRIDSSVQDGEKDKINDTIVMLLIRELKQSASYKPSIERVGKISSSDGRVHVYSWNFQGQSLVYKYGGIIHFKNSTENKWFIVRLMDTKNTMPQTGFVRPDQWYGALYYDILVNKYKQNTYYTLLGWDGGDGIIAKKIVDNFTIENEDDVKLGYPLFRIDGRLRSRIIFQFNARGSMMLAYDPSYKKIVFDHLSPDVPTHSNQFQYYGPDFTYDGFKFNDGKWWFERNVDVRNKAPGR